MRWRSVLVVGATIVAACGPSATVRSGDARPAGDDGPGTSAPTTTTPGDTTPDSRPPTTDEGPPTTSRPVEPLAWGSCSKFRADFAITDLIGLDRDRIQCATFTVPLDWSQPDGATIDLAVARLPARDADRRIGSLFLNPGGPGGSGLEYLPQFTSQAADDLLDSFDIVSWDPRGVALSTPINCYSDAERDAGFDSDPTPDDPAERLEFLDQDREANAKCAAQFPDLVPHMGTVSVARDLDALRAAVGDDRLTYLGASYGTLIGGVYAQLFPDRVRALVLDGALPPDPSLTGLRDGQFEGFRQAFARFVQACADDSSCPLDDARAKVDELLRQAAKEPIPTNDPDRPLTEGRAFTALGAALYDAESWPDIWDAIDSALQGNALILGFLADLYAGRRPDGSWTNGNEAFTAVMCADNPERPSRAETEAAAQAILAADPLWGPQFADGALLCEGTADAIEPVPTPLVAAGAPPIVVVGTTGDPATPYQWAKELAASLESGVLVTYQGNGHTAYGTSTCVTRIVDAYLLTGAAPAGDQDCVD